MKNRFHLLATAVVSLLCVSCTETQVSQSGSEKAVNPPIMGWSSWNAFRVDISEDIIKNQADLMVKKGLKDAGYHYINIDDGFFGERDGNGKMQTNKNRFPNGMTEKNGTLCWDVERLFTEIKNGLKVCKELGKIPVSMAIDTWAVDYVLLDENDKILGDTAGYRDSRTNGMDEKVYEKIPLGALYARTGIQKQIFNTIYQLMAVKENYPEQLEQAESMLMIPDYFQFLLTGVKKMEYTNATTTQLVSPQTKDWDYELIDLLGFNRKIFKEISMPGTVVGNFTKEIQEEVGFDCTVVLPATHDTGSAVLAVPTNDDNAIYISSGTWS